jgi:MSHA pilin protein MshA
MKQSQSGFTLIELVVVIVLLGILGVTALGKFQDLSGNAEAAAVKGVASELSASAAINFANSTLNNTGSVTVSTTGTIDADGTVDACLVAGLGNLFATNSFPAGYYSAPNTAANCTAVGATFSCEIHNDSNNNGSYDVADTPSETATLICTGS